MHHIHIPHLVSQLADVVGQGGIEAGRGARGPGRSGGSGLARAGTARGRAGTAAREHGGEVQRGEVCRRRVGEGAEYQGELVWQS